MSTPARSPPGASGAAELAVTGPRLAFAGARPLTSGGSTED
jgi:hypothetical protein